MGYHETVCNLCKQCYVKRMKPSKKVIKNMELTSCKFKCEECGRMDRIVEYVWEPDEGEE